MCPLCSIFNTSLVSPSSHARWSLVIVRVLIHDISGGGSEYQALERQARISSSMWLMRERSILSVRLRHLGISVKVLPSASVLEIAKRGKTLTTTLFE